MQYNSIIHADLESYLIQIKGLHEEFYWSNFIKELFFVLDDSNRIVFYNQEAQETFSIDNEIIDIQLPEFSTLSSNGEIFRFTINDEEFSFHARAEKHKDYKLVFLRDVSCEVKAKNQVRQINEFYENLLQNIPFGYVHCKISGPFQQELVVINSNENIRSIIPGNQMHNGSRLFLTFPFINEETKQKILSIANHSSEASSFEFILSDKQVFKFTVFSPLLQHIIAIAENITVTRQSVQAIKESEERLQLALRATSEALIDYNVKEERLYFSPRFYNMLGYQENVFEPSAQSWIDLVHPDDLSNIIESDVKEILHGNDFFRAEFRMRTNTDKWKWILGRGQVVKRDNNGFPIRVVGTHEDIDQEKKIHQQLKAHENQMKRLINNVDGMVYKCEYDEDWTMRFISEGAEKLTGYNADEMIGNVAISYNDIIYEPDRQMVWDKVSAFENKNEVFDLVYRIKTRNGNIKWVHERGTFVTKNDGLKVLEGLIIDVTAQKIAEDALNRSEKKLRAYITNAPDGIVVADNEFVITDTNNAVIVMTGFEKEHLRGKPFLDLIHHSEENSKGFFRNLQEIGRASAEMQIKRKDQTNFYSVISAVELPDKSYLIFIKDINSRKMTEIDLRQQKRSYEDLANRNEKQNTKLLEINEELNKAREKAEKSEQLKSAFLANMSHEIRTPMNGILGFSRLLINPNLHEEKRNRYIQVIERSGDQLLNIINNVLDISKIETEQMKVFFEELNMQDIIDEVFLRFSQDVSKKGLEFNKDNGKTKLFLHTDQNRIMQVFTNLITNAMKFTDNGAIEIGCKQDNENVLCYVKDTGTGIEKNELNNIFERFHQASGNIGQVGGTGLGLAISKGLVELLDGQIWAESAPGKGSTFFFTLPLK